VIRKWVVGKKTEGVRIGCERQMKKACKSAGFRCARSSRPVFSSRNPVLVVPLHSLELVGLLIALIAAVRAIREARHRRETRMLQSLYGAKEAARDRLRRPSDDFHDQVWLPLCNLIAEQANRLGRPLTLDDRRRIWRSRSSLVLETLLREIEHSTSLEPLEKALQDLPPGMDRPDPTGWCDAAP
jgi:hypothetical protein